MAETCETCMKASNLITKEYVFCSKYGIVSSAHHCKKYEQNMISKTVRRKRAPLMAEIPETE